MKDYMDRENESNFSITPFSLDNQHSRSTHIETALANRRGSQSIYVGSLNNSAENYESLREEMHRTIEERW